MRNKKLGREVTLYVLVGGSGLLVDLLAFYLLRVYGWGIPAANIVARHVGAVYTFWFNRNYTFAGGGGGPARDRSGREFFGYLLLLYAAMGVSTGLLWLLFDYWALSSGLRWQALGKLFIDALCAALNFLACKFLIFKHPAATR